MKISNGVSKKTIITIIIAIVVIAGLSYGIYKYFSSAPVSEEEEEKETKGEVSILLENLKQETGIDFSEELKVEFPWYIEAGGGSGEVDIQGKGFEALGVSSQDHKNVESFFEDNGFEIDPYNVASGTVAGLTGYKKEEIVCTVAGRMWLDEQGMPIEEDKNDVEVKCGKLAETADWNSYTNEKYGYSFKYPKNCLYGPLSGDCKQSLPEERPEECLCYLNAENPDEVSLGTFTGEKPILSGASFTVSHHSTDMYNPPDNADLIEWLKEKFITLDIPNEANIEIDGVLGAKIYIPQSPMAFSYEEIFFIKDNKLFDINMIDVDNENNRELYDKILSTFKFSDAGLANPATVYCLEIGGELIQIVDEKGVAGYCILPDNRICAEWKLFYSEGEECVPPEEPAETSSKTNTIAIMKTNFGEIKIELFSADAPKTVENFIKLSESGFYNATKFHRVIKGFMIQAGDPLSKDDSLKDKWGTGGPGYSFLDEIHSNNHNVAGTISMANAGPNTNGSQFFINTNDNGFLDTKHTVFGRVIAGMDVVRSIENVSTQGPDRPVNNVIIQSIKIP